MRRAKRAALVVGAVKARKAATGRRRAAAIVAAEAPIKRGKARGKARASKRIGKR